MTPRIVSMWRVVAVKVGGTVYQTYRVIYLARVK